MSEPVSALIHANFEGIARIEETGLQGMITLRGDLSDKSLAKAVKKVTGTEMPARNCAKVTGAFGVCWMSPDEVLILLPHADTDAALGELTKALKGQHALAVNVSDARAIFQVSGPIAREVLAKLAPVDFSREAFRPGQFRRSRLAQVPAAIWADDEDIFRIICFRSVAEYVFNLLKVAAQPGSEVAVY